MNNKNDYQKFNDYFARYADGVDGDNAFTDIYLNTIGIVRNTINKFIIAQDLCSRGFTFREDFMADVIGETYKRFIKKYKGIHNPAAIVAWMRKTTYNCCVDVIREPYYSNAIHCEDIDSLSDKSVSCEVDILRCFDEMASGVLTPSQYYHMECFIEKYEKKNTSTYEYLAKMFNCECGTIKSRIHKCRMLLKKANQDFAA